MQEPPTASRRDRLERIRAWVVEDGFVRVERLAEAFGVSTMTVHRDLDELERQGWLRKVRGGATAQPSVHFHGDVRHRLRTQEAAKEQLARAAAARFLSPGASVMLDESTTAYALVDLLPEHGPLTVVTHFLPAISELAGKPGVDLIALGGTYFPAYDAFFGIRTVSAIETLRADVLFMSTTAISDGVCCHQSEETLAVKRALMAAARSKVLLVDHTKFEMQALHELAPLDAFDMVIVDDRTPDARVAELRDAGIAVEVAGAEDLGGDVVRLDAR